MSHHHDHTLIYLRRYFVYRLLRPHFIELQHVEDVISEGYLPRIQPRVPCSWCNCIWGARDGHLSPCMACIIFPFFSTPNCRKMESYLPEGSCYVVDLSQASPEALSPIDSSASYRVRNQVAGRHSSDVPVSSKDGQISILPASCFSGSLTTTLSNMVTIAMVTTTS